MILVAPEKRHLDELFANLRDEDLDVIDDMSDVVEARKTAEEMIKVFPSQVFVTDKGKVAALWILVIKWNGVAEIVAYTTNEVETNRVAFHKACLRGIDYAVDFYGLHRLQAYVWGDYVRSIKWLERLGFKVEGVMRQFGPNKVDATMLGRIF